MPEARANFREAQRLIEVAKNTKDPRARAEILDLAEACLKNNEPGAQQQQQEQPRVKEDC